MNIIFDNRLVIGFVYEVDVIIDGFRVETVKNRKNKYEDTFTFRTTFNQKQPNVAIDRAINKSKIEKENVTQVEVKFIQELSESNI